MYVLIRLKAAATILVCDPIIYTKMAISALPGLMWNLSKGCLVPTIGAYMEVAGIYDTTSATSPVIPLLGNLRTMYVTFIAFVCLFDVQIIGL